MSTSAAAVRIIGAIGAFFSFGVAGPLFIYVGEMYPTGLRATGVGISGSRQRIGGIVAPYIFGVFVEANISVSLIFAFVGALMLACGILVGMRRSCFLAARRQADTPTRDENRQIS